MTQILKEMQDDGTLRDMVENTDWMPKSTGGHKC